jgi:hypothetical protein
MWSTFVPGWGSAVLISIMNLELPLKTITFLKISETVSFPKQVCFEQLIILHLSHFVCFVEMSCDLSNPKQHTTSSMLK